MAKDSTKQNIQRQWRLIDADGKILGRLSTQVATYLRGKNRASFQPHKDEGDMVVIVNTDRIRVTGGKERKKMYRWHTWYPHGFNERTFEQMMKEDSREVIRQAVFGMLPKNRLRHRMITRLKLYKGAEHPHTSAPFVKEGDQT